MNAASSLLGINRKDKVTLSMQCGHPLFTNVHSKCRFPLEPHVKGLHLTCILYGTGSALLEDDTL
jgi:hypothetical protein